MIAFWITAMVMIAVALVFVVPPLMGRLRSAGGARRDELNAAVYRDQLAELDAQLAREELDEEEHARLRDELGRRLLRDVGGAEEPRGDGDRGAGYTAVIVAVGLPMVALGLYLAFGEPATLLGGGASAPTPAEEAQATPDGMPHSVEDMIASLEERLAAAPDDPEGWLVLGRSYAAINRLEDARRALEQANRLRPRHPLTLVAYAEVLAGLAGNRLEGEPLRLVEQALEIDPGFVRARWLAGIGAFNRGDATTAIAHWQRILAEPGLDERSAAQVREAIAQAREAAGLPATAAQATAQAGAQAGTPAGTGGAGPPRSLRVSVALSPDLADRVKGDEVLLVFAKAAQGPPMPLAVARLTAGALPAEVVLDDSMAMMPQLALSRFPSVVVTARISRTGNAQAASGDLQGASPPVTPGDETPVSVVIDEVVP